MMMKRIAAFDGAAVAALAAWALSDSARSSVLLALTIVVGVLGTILQALGGQVPRTIPAAPPPAFPSPLAAPEGAALTWRTVGAVDGAIAAALAIWNLSAAAPQTAVVVLTIAVGTLGTLAHALELVHVIDQSRRPK